MKQILGIFVKDARHQWLEILISFAAILTLAFTYHSRWKTDAGLYTVSFSMFGLASRLPDLLIFFIVPLSWWLLTSRAIHEEKLVGDRQFWITRPYEWKKLLAAKLLFLAVFLYVPLFMAQCVILAQAGFSPFHFLPGLLYDSLLFMVVTVLPLVVLATVTRNFARMTLADVGRSREPDCGCVVGVQRSSGQGRLAVRNRDWIRPCSLSMRGCHCGAICQTRHQNRMDLVGSGVGGFRRVRDGRRAERCSDEPNLCTRATGSCGSAVLLSGSTRVHTVGLRDAQQQLGGNLHSGFRLRRSRWDDHNSR